MDILKSITLGAVQGLTEFLPVSSSAHLKIIPALLHWPDPGAPATAVMQLGTLAAVLVYFAKDIRTTVAGMLRALQNPKERDTPEARLGLAVIVGTIPICVAGLATEKLIEGPLRSLYVIAGSLIVMGIVLYAADVAAKKHRPLSSVTLNDGIVVGLAQVLSLIPGSSRSGSTMTGAFLTGLDREAALRFSFLLSIPAVALSGLYELYSKFYKHKAEMAASMSDPSVMHWTTPDLLLTTVVAGLVGYASIAFLLKYLAKHSTLVFVGYRIVLGIVLFVLLKQGVLTP